MPDATRLAGEKIGCVTSVPFFLVTQLTGTVVYLSQAGAQVTAVTSVGSELRQVPWSDSLRHVAVDIRRRPAPWHDLIAVIKLVSLFRRHRFGIVHSTTPKAGLLTALAGWIARVPVRLHTFTGQQWVTMSGPLRWISRWSDRVIGYLNTRVYADSSSQRQFLIDEGIVRGDKIGVVGAGSLAGVDVERFNPRRFTAVQRLELRKELGIAEDSVVVTFIGRIAREKGIRELLDAVLLIQDEGYRVEVLLVGPMDEMLESDVGAQRKAEAGSFGGQAGVHVVGYTDSPERYLAITEILCLPSYREGFGTVVIEAAAMRVPTVGTRITGLSDAIVDEETGLLVSPRDAYGLADALRRLLADPLLRRRLGDAARERCLSQFDADIVNGRLAEEYINLLKVARSSAAHGQQ